MFSFYKRHLGLGIGYVFWYEPIQGRGDACLLSVISFYTRKDIIINKHLGPCVFKNDFFHFSQLLGVSPGLCINMIPNPKILSNM